MEEWRDVKGYEGLYQVSNEGRVKSLERDIVLCNDGRIRHQEEKLLRPGVDGKGYLFVVLCKDGKKKTQKVHRLITEAFIPNPLNLPQVNHKDEDKTNNRVFINEDGTIDQDKSNLEWCTNEYNHNYGTRNQRASERIAEARSKQVYQYTLDGTLVKIWSSTKECGRNGFGQSLISACCNGKRKQHKGFRWSYVPL